MSQVRGHDCYVSHKVNKLRWLGDSDVFVTGSWNEPLYTQWRWGMDKNAQQNRLCFWHFDLEQSASFEQPQIATSVLHSGDVTDMQCMQNRVITGSSTGEVLGFTYHPDSGHTDSMTIGSSHQGVVTGVGSTLDDADRVVSCGEDGRINTYSLSQQSLLSSIKTGQSMTALALQNESSKLFTSNTSGHLRFWDLNASQKPQLSVLGESTGAIHSLDIHPSRPFLVATGNEDGSICIWELRNLQQPLCRYKQHQSSVWEVRFHPVVPDYLLSSADDGNLLIWDFHSPNSIHTQYSGKERLATHKLLHSPLSLNSFDVHKKQNILVAGSDNQVLHTINLGLL